MHIPVKSFKKLFHVGHLQNLPATHSRSSLEGPSLSVSEVPEAWRRIARLGDAPGWRLTKFENQFLNVHRISKKLKKAVQTWALENDYVDIRQACYTEYDEQDENGDDETRTCFSASLKEAIRTIGKASDEIRHTLIDHPFPTDKLHSYAREKVNVGMSEDFILMAYTELILQLDGLFWNETLDIFSYSAPRAGIFPGKLKEWTIAKAEPKELIDWREM